MKNSYQDDRYFKTSSFYTACWLLAKDCELANVDKLTDSKKAHFVFVNSPELETLLHIYNFAKEDSAELLVSVRTFITSIKQLKNALYQDTF